MARAHYMMIAIFTVGRLISIGLASRTRLEVDLMQHSSSEVEEGVHSFSEEGLENQEAEYLNMTAMLTVHGKNDCAQAAEVCCCKEVRNAGECKDGSKEVFFHEGCQPGNDASATSHTCHARPLCCRKYSKPECPKGSGPFGAMAPSYPLRNIEIGLCSELAPITSERAQATKPLQSLDPLDLLDGPTDVDFLTILDKEPNQKMGGDVATRRDYTVIVDRSASMNAEERTRVPEEMAKYVGDTGDRRLSRWAQAQAALQFLTPHVVDEDPDGVSMFFFDYWPEEHTGICSAETANSIFAATRPGCWGKRRSGGCTFLADVLEEAMKPDTIGRAETIFVITDGLASDQEHVKQVIAQKSQTLCRAELLSISFIQVGNDEPAAEYLDYLDDRLVDEVGAKYDIVDALSYKEIQDAGTSFLEVVARSLHD